MKLSWLAPAALVLALGGCEKKSNAPAAPPPAPPTVAADGTRTIPINVNSEGYAPARITAKPGEKLELVFTRRTKSSCAAQVKIAGGTPTDLPVDQPVAIAVTAPASGKIDFACGMDMMSGVIVVD